MRIHVMHPGALGASELARWRALTTADPALASPFFSVGYAQAVAAARSDARLAVIEVDNAIQGFFAVQRPSRFTAMPLGTPMTDQQGVVGAADLPVRASDLCRALKVDRIDYAGVLAHQGVFSEGHRGVAGSWVAQLDGGAEGYLSTLRARRVDTVRRQDKKLRRIDDERGAPVFTCFSRNRAHLDQLLAWKQDQCRRTRQPPIWATPWVLDVVNAAWESEQLDFRGALFTLTVGETLVAANFFLAGQTVLNDWLIGHDHAFDAYSPGVMLARKVCEWAAENGFREVDFGPGDYQYKRHLTTTQRNLAWGFVGRPSAATVFRGAQYGARALLEGGAFGRYSELPGKAMRRLDVCRGLGVPLLAAH